MREEILVGIFGFLQLSLKDSDYEIVKGKVKPNKHDSLNELDIKYIYNWFADRTSGLPLESHVNTVNTMVSKLLNKDAKVNNFYMGLHLGIYWIETYGSGFDKNLMLSKMYRLIDETKNHINIETAKNSYRVADNLWRQANEKAQLSDEVRDAKFKRLFSKARS
jgi:hypothetical protein